MNVKRIVSNIASSDAERATQFYRDIFGLDLLMDLGWIRSFGSNEQISIASEGGSGTAAPGLSVEVDGLEEALARVKATRLPIEYGPQREPWGVRRFYVRDPFRKVVNVLQHE